MMDSITLPIIIPWWQFLRNFANHNQPRQITLSKISRLLRKVPRQCEVTTLGPSEIIV